MAKIKCDNTQQQIDIFKLLRFLH